MRIVLKAAWPLLFGIAMLMLGNGLQGSLLGLRASIEGMAGDVIGLVMSGYFLGLLTGILWVPAVVERVGHIRVFAALASLFSMAILMQAIFIGPLMWFIMRVLTGSCMAGLYIVAESWLNEIATNETRGKLLSVYMIVLFASLGIGNWLLNLADPGGFILFILVSLLVSFALVPISLVRVSAPAIEVPEPVSLKSLYKISPLGSLTALLSGISMGAIFGMGAVFGSNIGFSVAEVSIFVSLFSLGVVLLQFPIGIVSDWGDRRTVMLFLACASTILAIACTFLVTEARLWFFIACTLFGGLALPLHSMAIAHTVDFVSKPKILGAIARLVMLHGLGAVIGSVLAGWAMYNIGTQVFFPLQAAVYAAIALFAAYRRTRREAIPVAEQASIITLQPQASLVAAVAVVEEQEEGADSTGPQAS